MYFGSKTPSNHQPRAVFIWVILWGYLEDTLTCLVGYIIDIPIVCDEKPNMLEILSINQQAHNYQPHRWVVEKKRSHKHILQRIGQ